MNARTYFERTPDHGCAMHCGASDNLATYVLTSARAKDLYSEFLRKHERIPSSSWYRRNFNFD